MTWLERGWLALIFAALLWGTLLLVKANGAQRDCRPVFVVMSEETFL